MRRSVIAASGLLAVTAVLAIADADPEDEGQRQLFSTLSGIGEPTFVFLPGIGATTRFWKYVLTTGAGPALGGRHLLVDLLGFGQSPKPWATYDVARHVAELRRVLKDVGHITLVGHSIGARLAIAYAAQYPEAVERLVLVSLPYFGGAERAKHFFRERDASGWIWTHLVPMALMCLFSRRLFGWAFRYLITSVPRVVAEDLTQMTWRSSTSTIWEVIYGHDLATDVRRLPAEMDLVCLHGDHDESAPLDRMHELQAMHQKCVIRVRHGANHQLPLFHQAWVRAHIASATVA
ncbi:MAG: alpha/beta hydrolase [Gemmatimonadaceae bacterium]|nr:alpha/beta hydrolase [Gemmatimonadaceae bacterium]